MIPEAYSGGGVSPPPGPVKSIDFRGFSVPNGCQAPGKKKKFKPPPGQIPEYAPGWLLSHILSKTFSFSKNARIYVQTRWRKNQHFISTLKNAGVKNLTALRLEFLFKYTAWLTSSSCSGSKSLFYRPNTYFIKYWAVFFKMITNAPKLTIDKTRVTIMKTNCCSKIFIVIKY